MPDNVTARPAEKAGRRNKLWPWAAGLLLTTATLAVVLYCYFRYSFHLDLSDAWGQAIVRHMDLSLMGQEVLRHRELRGAWPRREADLLETALHRDLLQLLLAQCSRLEFRAENEDVLTIAGRLVSSYDLNRAPAAEVKADGFLLQLSWPEKISGQKSDSGTPGLRIELTGQTPPVQAPQGRAK